MATSRRRSLRRFLRKSEKLCCTGVDIRTRVLRRSVIGQTRAKRVYVPSFRVR